MRHRRVVRVPPGRGRSSRGGLARHGGRHACPRGVGAPRRVGRSSWRTAGRRLRRGHGDGDRAPCRVRPLPRGAARPQAGRTLVIAVLGLRRRVLRCRLPLVGLRVDDWSEGPILLQVARLASSAPRWIAMGGRRRRSRSSTPRRLGRLPAFRPARLPPREGRVPAAPASLAERAYVFSYGVMVLALRSRRGHPRCPGQPASGSYTCISWACSRRSC